jgi:hypothetical protein
MGRTVTIDATHCKSEWYRKGLDRFAEIEDGASTRRRQRVVDLGSTARVSE